MCTAAIDVPHTTELCHINGPKRAGQPHARYLVCNKNCYKKTLYTGDWLTKLAAAMAQVHALPIG